MARKGAAIGMFDPDTWKQQLATLMSAPYIIFPLLAIVAAIVWWFRGTMFQSTIDGLREQIKVLEAQKTIFDAQLQLAANKSEFERWSQDGLARQFNDFKAEVMDGAGIGVIAARIEWLETALNELVAANNAVRSAIGIAIGASSVRASSVTDTVSDLYSNTPLVLREEAERIKAEKERPK
jgi:hypothetical protein